MFDLFSWSHIVILLAVALVVVGPKDLPRLMHMAGKWAGKARAMANEFRKSFDEMARQAELDELRKEIDDLKKNNPITEMANSMAEVGSVMSQTAAVTEGAVQTPAETTAPVEGHIEPRSGEFAVTDAAAPASSNEPAAP
ncbi:MAG TPA: Sec-independent protein translocase protein TatB [Rhizomicrobium sp.]|jgi:sec-independent protein translocase protein TatB|nr:Sec-independent protein translocase protein TatB [Rhizomicrobium sp.]